MVVWGLVLVFGVVFVGGQLLLRRQLKRQNAILERRFESGKAQGTDKCPKCGGEMDKGRVPIGLRFLVGYKSLRHKRWSFEVNPKGARACLQCGFLELYLDPRELESKRQ